MPPRAPTPRLLTRCYYAALQGHRAFAKDLFLLLEPRLKAIEFKTLADILTSGEDAQQIQTQEASAVSKAPQVSKAVLAARFVVAACGMGMLAYAVIARSLEHQSTS